MYHGLILMYHGVVPDGYPAAAGDWLQVPESLFIKQLAWLSRWFDPVDPVVFTCCTRQRRPRLLITFDDGYVNNYEIAEPILRKFGFPALFFISTGYLSHSWFWWDRLRIAYSKIGRLPVRTQELKALAPSAIENSVSKLLEDAGADPHPPSDPMLRPMTWAEVSDFARRDGVFVGNHGHAHEIFSRLDLISLQTVLETSQQLWIERVGVKPTWIAPPNGEWNTDQEPLIASCGFNFLCGTQRGWVRKESTDTNMKAKCDFKPPESQLTCFPRLGVGCNDSLFALTRRLVHAGLQLLR